CRSVGRRHPRHLRPLHPHPIGFARTSRARAERGGGVRPLMSSAQVVDAPSSRVALSSRALEGAASSLAERIAPWVAAIASVWFALAAAWGLFGPIPAGHYGTMGGEGIIGENMVRWHILGPVWDYVSTRPTPSQYYCHHPWGGFWIMGIVS